VLRLRARLLKHLPRGRDNDGICSEDELWVPAFGDGEIELLLVDVHAFLGRGAENVFDGGEAFGEVFGEGGGDDGGVQAESVGEEGGAAGRGRGEDEAQVAEVAEEGEVEGGGAEGGWDGRVIGG